MTIHHTIYAANAELVADASARRITPARLRDLQQVDEFDTDENEDYQVWMSKRAVAALGPDVEHFILRATTADRDIWTFGTYGDSIASVYELLSDTVFVVNRQCNN